MSVSQVSLSIEKAGLHPNKSFCSENCIPDFVPGSNKNTLIFMFRVRLLHFSHCAFKFLPKYNLFFILTVWI